MGTDVNTPEGASIIDQVRANIERAHSLSAEGNADALAELRTETETLISGLSGKGSIARKKELRDAMKEVPEPAEPEDVSGEVVQRGYEQYEGVTDLIYLGAERIAEGVRLSLKTSEVAREGAQVLFDIWRRIPNKDGDPDIMGTSQDARDAAAALYRKAGEGFEDSDETRAALARLQRSVQYHRSQVRTDYLRMLDSDSAEAKAERSRFAGILNSKPENVSAAEFVAEHYGTSLKSQREVEAERQAGTLQLEAPLKRVDKVLRETRKAIKAAKPEDFEALDTESKAAKRKELSELLDAVKAMIDATM